MNCNTPQKGLKRQIFKLVIKEVEKQKRNKPETVIQKDKKQIYITERDRPEIEQETASKKEKEPDVERQKKRQLVRKRKRQTRDRKRDIQ